MSKPKLHWFKKWWQQFKKEWNCNHEYGPPVIDYCYIPSNELGREEMYKHLIYTCPKCGATKARAYNEQA